MPLITLNGRSTATVRKYFYAALLALGTLNFLPARASAQQPVHGHFTLPHEVRWQSAIVPAGDYRFSIESDGFDVLYLDKISGTPAGFMFLVHDKQVAKPPDLNRLLLQTTPTGSYVSALQLPEFGLTLSFRVPSAAEKQIAKATAMAPASAQ